MWTKTADGSIVDQDGRVIYFSTDRFEKDICLGCCCFICGAQPGSKPFNNEHILPDWLLGEYGLYDRTITLPNGQRMRYGSYTVPCCEDCNTLMAREIEQPVSAILKSGLTNINDFVVSGGLIKIFVWAGLIFLKTHLKDRLLRYHLDRRKGDAKIADDYDWSDLHHIHCVVRSFYTNCAIQPEVFGSFLSWPASPYPEAFDFVDLSVAQTMHLRLGEGVVIGVAVRLANGETIDIGAKAVVLASGGLSRRANVQRERPNTREDHLSMAAPKADGSLISMAENIGAEVASNLESNFYWAPMSQARHSDGRLETFPHIVTDRAKPGIIAVTETGQRFTNEADSYHRFSLSMQKQQSQGTHRFYLIADHRALKFYGLGLARPSPGNNTKLLEIGYLIQEPTIARLAMRLEINPSALEETITRCNRDAAIGKDSEFRKGDSSYNRAMGDNNAANPCFGPIDTAPFYAVQIHTGDLGSAKGLVTDSKARVLRHDGSIIDGLFAVGSDMNSVMAGTYPGPGITLGPGLTFAYIAAREISDSIRGLTSTDLT